LTHINELNLQHKEFELAPNAYIRYDICISAWMQISHQSWFAAVSATLID